MTVIVVIENRYTRTPDGAIWTPLLYGYSFWLRYLDVFDKVKVVARIKDVFTIPGDYARADGERVSFAAIPFYSGPWQYLRQTRKVQRVARAAVGPADAVILRLDSQIAASLEPILCKTNRPYGAEVVVDPYDGFSPGSYNHPLRPIFRWWFPRKLRQQCLRACAVAYVTETALQERYPPDPHAYTTHYSSVDLPEDAFVATPRTSPPEQETFTLVTVSELDHLRKAPDVVIDAVKACVAGGLNLQLVVIGEGKCRPELEARAARLGLGERVRFLGRVPTGEHVRAQLDKADLFLLPSRGEGLPRALIEAMARGLPAIGSTLPGFHEVLPPEDLVPAGDAAALDLKIREVVTSPERLNRMSVRNLRKSKHYAAAILRERRIEFYRQVKVQTEKWIKSSSLT